MKKMIYGRQPVSKASKSMKVRMKRMPRPISRWAGGASCAGLQSYDACGGLLHHLDFPK